MNNGIHLDRDTWIVPGQILAWETVTNQLGVGMIT